LTHAEQPDKLCEFGDQTTETGPTRHGKTLGDYMGKILQSMQLSIVTGLVLTVLVAVIAPIIAG